MPGLDLRANSIGASVESMTSGTTRPVLDNRLVDDATGVKKALSPIGAPRRIRAEP